MSMNQLAAESVIVAITMLYLIIVLVVYKINHKKEYEDEVIKNKKFFNGVLIGQIIGTILIKGYSICINGPTTQYAVIYGVPFMIVETIICSLLKLMKNKKVSAILIKIVTIIGIVVMAVLICATARTPKDGGNIPIMEE